MDKSKKIEKNTLLTLIIVYLIFTIIRFAISLLIQNPLIPTDELAYKNIAYSFFKTGTLNSPFVGYNPNIPNFLYPLLISVSFFFKENFFVFIKLINSLIMNLSIFSFFLILKEFVSEKKALLSSSIILLLPVFNYINFAMVESLFFTLFWFTFITLINNLNKPSIKKTIILGLMFSLLYLTKPTAVSIIISFIASTFTISLYKIIKNDDRVCIKKLIISLVITIITFLFVTSVINLIFKETFSISLGFYGQFSSIKEFNLIKIIEVILGHIILFLFLYLIPFIISIFALIDSLKQKRTNRVIFLVLGFLLFLSLLITTLQLTINVSQYESFSRIHARYYSMIFPFFIMSFVIFSKIINWNLVKKVLLSLLFIVISLINILFIVPKYINTGLLIVDYPDIAFLLISKNLVYIPMILTILVMISYLKQRVIKPNLLLILIIIMNILGNFGEINNSIYFDSLNTKTVDVCKSFFQTYIPEGSNITLISSNLGVKLYTQFWLNYDYICIYDDFASINSCLQNSDYIISYDQEIDINNSEKYKKEECNILKIR